MSVVPHLHLPLHGIQNDICLHMPAMKKTNMIEIEVLASLKCMDSLMKIPRLGHRGPPQINKSKILSKR